jgi:hypothetical protein
VIANLIERITAEIETVLYPELRPYRRNDRTRLLRKASETPLDSIEGVGILVALVLVVSVTRYGVADLVGWIASPWGWAISSLRFSCLVSPPVRSWYDERDAESARN